MAFPVHIAACGGFVFNRQGQLLLVKTHRGYECPGGQVEEGESLIEGVLREIKEESGVTASVRCLIGLYSNVGKRLSHDGLTLVPTKVIFDFLCDYSEGELQTSVETSEVLWVTPERALDYVTSPSMRPRLQQALQFKGQVLYASYVTSPEYRLLSQRLV